MAPALPAQLPTGATVRDVIAGGERSFSFEFFPPKDDAGERRLWQAIRELEPLRPTFASVTYGAGGSTRDRTVRITETIATDTTLTPVGHLTCVGQTRDEMRHVIGQYAGAGVGNVLALRDDPAEGLGAEWIATEGGLDHAVELVEMLRDLGSFSVGVAAFPEGHPEAVDLESDAKVLLAKEQAGADFAVTQFFFRARDYFDLVERATELGVRIPVIPGIMPITNLAQIQKMAQLSGAELPSEIVEPLIELGEDKAAVRASGIDVATQLCHELLEGGAPGLHFYTLNRSTATREIFAGLPH